MVWQSTPWADPLLFSTVVSATLAVFGLLYVSLVRRDRRVVAFATLMVGAAVWTLGYSFQFASATLPDKLRWTTVAMVGEVVVPVAWFTFAAAYTRRREWLRRERMAALWAVPLVTVALAVTNGAHGLVWRASRLVAAPDGAYVILERASGPWLLVHGGYSYLVAFAGVAFLVAMIEQSRGIYWGQAAVLFTGMAVPAGATLVSLAGVGPTGVVDLTPPSIAVLGVAFAVAIFRYRLFDLVPVARASVVENMGEGYVLLDESGDVVDLNAAARSLLDGEDGRLIGRDAREVFGADLGVLDRFAGETTTETIETDGRYLELTVSTVEADRVAGCLVAVRDVTERKRRELELRRTNERLDRFASFVSHDLRNPLQVAMGHLDIAMTGGETESLETVRRQHERMEQMIADLLSMARDGREVEETAPVDLDEAARQAWNSVETEDASLVVDADRRIVADDSRLSNLLENLFRNAVEHGSTGSRTESDDAVEHGSTEGSAGLTVTVETTADGFAASDDGVGIPERERDQILEFGHTTESGNTGFGLAIVDEIATAHGWTVRVAESDAGGARFEFESVELVDPPRDFPTSGDRESPRRVDADGGTETDADGETETDAERGVD